MTGMLEYGIKTLIHNGLIEILIFALIFAVTFGILQNVELFGKDKLETKRYNAIIALVFGALAVLPSLIAPGSKYDIVPIIQRALPQTMLVLVALLGVLILLGMFGWTTSEFTEGNNWLRPIIAIILILIVVWIFIAATPFGWRFPYWFDRDIIAVVVAIAVFGVIVYWVMSGGDEKSG